MKILNFVQGSPEWVAVRAQYRTASEASAMMGESKKLKRNELLHMKSTGGVREFSDWVQKNLLDKGHEIEANARAIAESIIGEDLYPVTAICDNEYLLASFDGLTMGGDTAWECKSWNEEKANAVAAGVVPAEDYWQVVEQLVVSRADRLLYMVTDGTQEKCVYLFFSMTAADEESLLAGWRQFDKDLANYKPVEVIPAAVATPTKELPTLFIQAKGEVTNTNMPEFKQQIEEFLGTINRKPATDQEFADGKATAVKLRELATKIKERKADMLAQTASIGEVAKEIDLLADIINANALELEKAVKKEEDARKLEIINSGRTGLAEHVAALSERIGGKYMPVIAADFTEAVKGKRLMSSMQDAVDTLLAQKKIEADAIAAKIEANLSAIATLAADHDFLFADKAQLVLKDTDAVEAIIRLRVAEHKAAEDRRAEAERVKKEAEAKAEEARAQAEQAAVQNPPAGNVQPIAQTLGEVLHAVAPPDIAQAIAPVSTGATIKLGDINARLGFTVTADFLATLGFPATTERNAKLYRAEDFPEICRAIINHTAIVANTPYKEAA